ncbi:disease resistance RPP8-like protein 3 [Elaeis guineensis]|uniref:Disease resistance protein RPM1-like n=1 Tax=Elaeis guineensis var. tenera TaxID=51953 RepID=A0A6I9QA14_ELAGV|nr:disease resistance protein RPM1-like [Elaeis guineensis]
MIQQACEIPAFSQLPYPIGIWPPPPCFCISLYGRERVACQRLAQSSECEMAEWAPMSVMSAVIDGVFDDILTNWKVKYEGWTGEESKYRIKHACKDIIEYLKLAEKQRERCSKEAKEKDFGEWAEDARKLLYRLEHQIEMSMLPTSRFPVDITSLSGLFCIGSGRWNARRRTLAKLVKEIEEVRNRMPEIEIMPTAVETNTSGFWFRIGLSDQISRVFRLAEGGGRKLIFIVGPAGTGKTSIARAVYYRSPVRMDCHCRSWAAVSMSSEKGVLQSVLTGFYMSSSNGYPSEIHNMDENKLRDEIRSYCGGKDYLLVLDDVVDKKAWDWLRDALPVETGRKGTIIFATWKHELPQAINESKEILRLEGLSDEDSLELFRDAVCLEDESIPPELKEIGKGILEKCKGNPFSIRAMAGIVRTKQATPEAWKDVLKDLDANLVECKNAGTDGNATDPFVLSAYADLPPHLKSCFLYCSMFPENSSIPRKRLIRLWIAEGYVQEIPGKTEEEAAEHQLQQLISRGMLHMGKYGVNGEVMSCGILQPVRRIALDICDKQNFGIFAPATGGRPSNNQAAPAKQHKRRHRRRTTPSHHRVLSVEVEGNAEEITKALARSFHLRSLLVFGKGELRRLFRRCQFPNPTNLKIWPYKLLRVLELQGVQIEFLPEQLGYLALLRYLGLRRTGVNRLPKSLGSLQYLKTLDIRETNVVEVSDVHRLQRMRHLHLASSFRGRSVNVRSGVSCLIDLQTLAGVTCTPILPQELRRLIQLRKLSVSDVNGNSSEQLCASISKMMLLDSLTIKCERGETFDLSFLSSPSNEPSAPLQHLRTLKLGGPMDKLLDLVSSLKSITYLYLWDSKLKEDPLQALQSLSNLVLLSLYNAYDGKHLRCNATGFQKLQKLSVLSLTELEKWEIEIGAMPYLGELFVGYCPKLKEPPEKLSRFFFLEVVQVAEMPKGFVEMVQEESQVKKNFFGNFKVQAIPNYQRT